MAQRPEHEKHEANGLAKDLNMQSAARQIERHPVLVGYLLVAAGTILVLFSVGFFPIFKMGDICDRCTIGTLGCNQSSSGRENN